MANRRVLSAILFFPRGGSAHAARALAVEVRRRGLHVRVVAGSRSDSDASADASRFFRGCDLHKVDFTPALASTAPAAFDGPAGTAPMHPSYEERQGAPDPVFAVLDEADLDRHVRAWARELSLAGAPSADVLHLHHLTPINEAAARVAPEVPIVGHLHGSELLFLEQVERGASPSWRYAGMWAERMRAWAARCDSILIAPGTAGRVTDLLGVGGDRLVQVPNGFDSELFRPREVDRAAHWRRHLVEQPRGWLPGEGPGSIRYRDEDLAELRRGVVLVYSGRFTDVKRVPMLIHAFERSRPRFNFPAGLVILGGYPGEWEGEHPVETVRSTGARDVFFCGWHEQEELPSFLSASDAVVLPSAREQFGQVIVEGMACGVPAVAAASVGPSGVVDSGRTGWLVPPDDEEALAAALAEVVNFPDETRRRGREAIVAASDRYSWPRIGARVAEVLDQAGTRASHTDRRFAEAAGL